MKHLLRIHNLFFLILLICTVGCFVKNGDVYISREQKEHEKEERDHKRHRNKGPQKVEKGGSAKEEEENEKYDGILAAQEFEFLKTHDPSLNVIPKERLVAALAQRRSIIAAKQLAQGNQPLINPTNTIDAINWVERGPNSDSAGPYGNGRDNNAVTAGRITAFWRDMDPSKPNQIFTGGIDGGLWTCSNITLSKPTWVAIDNFSNLAISSICQDPTNYNIMYFGTGEKTYNVDGVRGGGIWKSTDHGNTWNFISNTATFYNVSRILCDKHGNVYVATIGPYGSTDGSSAGLQRSTNGGSTWTKISPAINSLITSQVSDMIYDSSIDRMGVYMGYYLPGNTTTKIGYCFGTPSTVTSATWNTPATPAAGAATAADSGMYISHNTSSSQLYQTVLAAKNGIVWALKSVYGTSTALKIYRSVDGGATWTLQSTQTNSAYGAGQGWYSIAIDCDPSNVAASTNNVMIGGLNVFKSTNGGTSFAQVSRWVADASAGSVAQYVHADVHNIFYDANRVITCSDGGVFYSPDAGATWRDRNTGLRIKQFYSSAVHPTSENYFLAGAQDNGSHRFTQPGLGTSTEVTGGDGAFVAIDQLNPNNQITSYVYNTYHVSTDGGANWSDNTFGNSAGQFINPFDFDSKTKKLYAAYTAGRYLRWDDPTTTQNTASAVSISAIIGSNILSAITVSPNLANTIYVAAGNTVAKVANANTNAPTVTSIAPPVTSGSYISSVVIGPNTSDQDILVTSSSYGTKKVFITSNGGTTWSNITGNLPDMPVRWGLFYPGSNTQILLATEAGVWYGTANGTSTSWQPSAGMPAVRCDMIKFSDVNGVVAVGTHGRGLWSAKINTQPKISFYDAGMSVAKTSAATTGCRTYKDYTTNILISEAPTGNATVTITPQGGGNAVLGVDYDFTTNGSFTSPANTVTFNSGVYPNKIPITVRIYDNHNNNAPQPQTVTFEYDISGSTNAIAGGSLQTYTVNITDLIRPAATTLNNQTIWSENWENSSTYANWTFIPEALIASPPNAIAFVPYYSGCSANINTTTAQILTTDADGYIAYCGSSIGGKAATALMYRSVKGVDNHLANMSVTFNYKSGANANITNDLVYSTDNGTTWTSIAAYAAKSATTNVTTALPSALNNTDFLIGWRYTQTAGAANSAYSFAVDDIVFHADVVPTPIESAVSATTLYETAGQSIDYYSSSKKVIATLDNPTSDLACVTAGIENAGNTWQPFMGGMRSQKTFIISPAQNNGSSYNATLYFTNEELAGHGPAALKILKTTASSISGANMSNSVLIDPNAVAAYSSYGTSFTATFTGFGRYVLVDNNVTLPVTLLGFTGGLSNDKALLQWSTANELSFKNFEIERSVDGADFYNIGTAQASGTPTGTHQYNFTDKNLSNTNYYRLKMVDRDGNYVYSNSVLIKYENSKQNVTVLNNPFTSDIRVRITLPNEKVAIDLFDVKGRKVYSNIYSGNHSNISVVPSGHLASGTYFLKVIVKGETYSFSVIKQ